MRFQGSEAPYKMDTQKDWQTHSQRIADDLTVLGEQEQRLSCKLLTISINSTTGERQHQSTAIIPAFDQSLAVGASLLLLQHEFPRVALD